MVYKRPRSHGVVLAPTRRGHCGPARAGGLRLNPPTRSSSGPPPRPVSPRHHTMEPTTSSQSAQLPDQPGYQGDPISSRLPTEHDSDNTGRVVSRQASRRMLHNTGVVHYLDIMPGEAWTPFPGSDRRPWGISLSARERTAGMTPQQVDQIRKKLVEIVQSITPEYFIEEAINSDLCGLMSINWDVALRQLEEGKL